MVIMMAMMKVEVAIDSKRNTKGNMMFPFVFLITP